MRTAIKKINTFTKLYLASRESLSRLVASIVPPHEIEDVVQETYVRICQAKNAEKILSKKSFMYTTARNLALDYQKKAATKLLDDSVEWSERESLIDDGDYDRVLNNVITNDEFSTFCEAVRQLPTQCRKVFVLKKVYGYSQKEIAKDMGLSESTVEKHISAGLKRCIQLAQRNNLTPQNSNVIRSKKRGNID
ncbi:RNA polymerase sigma factor [Paraglaciecola chathamensis]|nr:MULTISPECIES: RNA polymerase sigma factor [Paraglaciecola]MDO6560761.1 RNA polymerase sigma factor [Paraglaciecola chathamensis]MDO6840187.1 RNA polymerase sigma factor [Paraglaciecola chathamensis]